MNYADADLGLSAASHAILAILSREVCHPDENGDEDTRCDVTTHAWYNGRENGVSLRVRATPAAKRTLIVIFGEHRHSDRIFVDAWTTRKYVCVPTPNDYPRRPDEIRTLFLPRMVSPAAVFIQNTINAFLDAAER